MAKNQEPESKHQESSDSDELVTESGSETGSESESEEDSPPKPPNPTPQSLPPPTNSSVSESLSGSETASESDSDADSSDSKHKIEPAATPELPKKAIPNPTPALQISPVRGSAVGVKRGAEKGAEPQDAKKAKKVESSVKKNVSLETGSASVGVGIEDSSKKPFQRVFSMDDEIVLLKGMLDFIAKKKSDPVANVDEFLEVVKKKLHLDVTKAQLLNKMKRLKGKYLNNASKVKDGHDVKISKSHERDSYELSKKIWGASDADNGDGGLENTKVNGSVVKKGGNKNAGAKVSAKDDDVPLAENGDGGLEITKVNGSVVKKGGNKNAGPKVSAKADDVDMVAVSPVKDDYMLTSKSIASIGVTDGVGGPPMTSKSVSIGVTDGVVYSALQQKIMSLEIENLDKEKKRELKKKLCEIEVAELELCTKRFEYMAERARLLLAAKKAEL